MVNLNWKKISSLLSFFILRFLKVLFGYIVAVILSGQYVIFTLALVDVNFDLKKIMPYIMKWEIWVLGIFASYMIFILTFLPATILLFLAEYKKVNNRLYYVVSAAIIGLLSGFIMSFGANYSYIKIYPYLGLIFGSFSGLVYWLITGRSAGR